LEKRKKKKLEPGADQRLNNRFWSDLGYPKLDWNQVWFSELEVEFSF
jgi:hypothetical protein